MMNSTLRIYQWRVLMWREWLRVRSRMVNNIVNNWFIWPTIFSISNGYFMPIAFFGAHDVLKGTELMVGMVMLHIFVLSYTGTIDLLSERLNSKVLQYHALTTSYTTMFMARLMFSVLFSFCSILPYFPVAKLILGDRFYTAQASPLVVAGVLFCMVVLANTYILCWLAIINCMNDFNHMWERGIEPLLWFGGIWAPGYAIANALPGGTTVAYLNPFVYGSDALRRAFLHDPRFAPIGFSCGVSLCAAVIFGVISYQLLKRRMDIV